MVVVSPHHKVRFFFLGIDVLFVVGDKVVKVEHVGIKSKVLLWRLGKEMVENGYGILNMKRRCSMRDIIFQKETT
jgi:hypothetical protein